MTREEAKKMLGENATEEAVSDLLNNFHNSQKASEAKIKELENKLNNQSDYADLKSKLAEINQAQMTEQEKIEAMNKEAAMKLANANKIFNTAKAKAILSGFELDESLISNLVTEDEATTIANATMFKTTLEAYKDNITKTVKSEISKMDIKPTASNVLQEDTGMTREKFSKMTMLEQKQWKDANLDQYREMFPMK